MAEVSAREAWVFNAEAQSARRERGEIRISSDLGKAKKVYEHGDCSPTPFFVSDRKHWYLRVRGSVSDRKYWGDF
jgi:hypothetical protein